MNDSKLWKIFSLYIRLRDANEDGFCTCCATGRMVHWSLADAGHFIGRRHLATKYDERNVNAQGRFSNRFNDHSFQIGKFIDKKYGQGTADKLLLLSRQKKSFSKFEIDVLIDYYKKEIEKIKKEKGL